MEHDHDEPDGQPEQLRLDPTEDERIRRLLVQARHTEPMPAAVVARLDDVLTDLHAERSARTAPVVDLAARRRRTAASLLVAAAAVVVAGVGVGQVLSGPGGGGGDAADTALQAPQAENNGAARSNQDSAGGKQSPAESPLAPESYASQERSDKDGIVRIRSDRFGADVRRAWAEVQAEDASAPLVASPAPSCTATPVGDGTVLAATYDDAAAVLVLRPPAGDTQVVDLYLCGADKPTRSITLALP